MKGYINIGAYFINCDHIRMVFDTKDPLGAKHSCVYVGGDVYHRFYQVTAAEICALIEKARI